MEQLIAENEKLRELVKANRALLIELQKVLEAGLTAVAPRMSWGGSRNIGLGYCEGCRERGDHFGGTCQCWCHTGFRMRPRLTEQLRSTDALLVELGERLDELNKDHSMAVEPVGDPHRHTCAAAIHDAWAEWRNPAGVVLKNDPCTCSQPNLPQCCENHPQAKAKAKAAANPGLRILPADVAERALAQLDR